MDDIKKMDVKLRYVLCLAVLALAVLLIGAGNVNNSMRIRDHEKTVASELC